MNDCLLSLKELFEIVKKLLGFIAVSHNPQFRDANTFPVGCASLEKMIHVKWETTASPNFGICDTTQDLEKSFIKIVSSNQNNSGSLTDEGMYPSVTRRFESDVYQFVELNETRKRVCAHTLYFLRSGRFTAFSTYGKDYMNKSDNEILT
jgi:hypothetical protein